MKPLNLVSCSIRTTKINSYVIDQIEIDLKHINYGLDAKRGYGQKPRSNFSAHDIISFFEALDGLELNFEKDDQWEYFIVDKPFFVMKKKYRMVFCINPSESRVAGVITLFQIRRGSI
jgi:hypothetical protein